MLSIWFASRHAVKPGGNKAPALLNLAQYPEPFKEQFPTDAHFWPYVCYKNSKPYELQVSVPTAGKKPKRLAGDEAVLCHYLVLEWDAPGHGALSDSDRRGFLAELARLDPDCAAAQFGVFYWTRGGARLCYRLSKPVDYSRYEPLVRSLQFELFKQTTIECDPTSDQWWRCYRLPQVCRDDGKDDGNTWEKPWYELMLSETTLDPDQIKPRPDQVPWDQRGKHAAARASSEMPDPMKSLGLITKAFKQEARKHLKTASCFPFIFDGLELPPGTRDSAMLKFPGQIVRRLYGAIDYLTPEHVYGLVLPTTDGIETDGEPLPQKLWRTTQHAWNAEAEKHTIQQEQTVELKDRHDEFLDSVLRNFRERDLPDDPDTRRRFAMKHLVCVHGLSHYTVTPGGRYGHAPLRAQQVPAALRDALPWFDGFYTDKGGMRSASQLLSDYSTNLHSSVLVPARNRGVQVVQENGAWGLHLTPFAVREDIFTHAKWDPEINEYIRSMGPRAEKALNQWFSNVLAIWEGNICALSLRGIKSTGKSMIALAVADAFGGRICHASVAFQRFNGPLMFTPVIAADEGLPKKSEGVPVPDLFRSYISGVGYAVEFKGLEPIQSHIGIRMIMTANNHELLRTLAGGKIMSRDDTHAIAERILHVDIDDRAAHFLAERGQHSFTSYSPKGAWIGGNPADGDMRFARHIAAIHIAARQDESSNTRFHRRLLTEGELEPKVIALLENGGITPEVAGVIAEDVEEIWQKENVNPSLANSLNIRDGQLWYRKRLYVTRVADKLHTSQAQVRRILDRWSNGQEGYFGKDKRTLWWGLKTEEIEEVAQIEGIDVSSLRELNQSLMRSP